MSHISGSGAFLSAHSDDYGVGPVRRRSGLAAEAEQTVDSPETALWRAVLLRLIEDAEGADCLERDQARRWFGSRDFYLVCDYASVHPPQVLERVAHVLL